MVDGTARARSTDLMRRCASLQLATELGAIIARWPADRGMAAAMCLLRAVLAQLLLADPPAGKELYEASLLPVVEEVVVRHYRGDFELVPAAAAMAQAVLATALAFRDSGAMLCRAVAASSVQLNRLVARVEKGAQRLVLMCSARTVRR